MSLVFRDHNDRQAGQRLPFTISFKNQPPPPATGKESIADEQCQETPGALGESQIMPTNPEPLKPNFAQDNYKLSTAACLYAGCLRRFTDWFFKSGKVRAVRGYDFHLVEQR